MEGCRAWLVEKPTRFFFSLMREREKTNRMEVVKDNDGVERSEQDELLDVIEGFYRDLFAREDVGVQDDLLEKVERVLSDEKRESCEGMLSVDVLVTC